MYKYRKRKIVFCTLGGETMPPIPPSASIAHTTTKPLKNTMSVANLMSKKITPFFWFFLYLFYHIKEYYARLSQKISKGFIRQLAK